MTDDKIFIHGCTNENFDCSGFSCTCCPFNIFNEECLSLSEIKKYLKKSKKIVKALELLIEKEKEEG